MEPATLIGIGGAGGAVARYAIDEAIGPWRFPWATVLVNVLGSFVLGLVVFGSVGSDLATLVGVGFCGAFTTYSSFSYATVRLWERGDRGWAAAHAVGTLVLALAAFGLAWLLVG